MFAGSGGVSLGGGRDRRGGDTGGGSDGGSGGEVGGDGGGGETGVSNSYMWLMMVKIVVHHGGSNGDGGCSDGGDWDIGVVKVVLLLVVEVTL